MFDGVITVKDGRKLGYAEYGSKEGYPVVLFHGTPGSRFQAFAHMATKESQAQRIIVPERPGYGLSDAQSPRTLFHHAADIDTLTTTLGIRRFSIVGISGGAPYALACANTLLERIDCVAIICGVGPLCEPELLAASAGLEQALISGTEAGAEYVSHMVAAAQHAPDVAISQLHASLPKADQALIGKEILAVYRDMLVEAMRVPDGIVDDYAVLAKPWDFSLADIHVPVHLWHSIDDDIVGIRHAEYLQTRLPKAVLHKLVDVGHSGTPISCAPQVMAYVQGEQHHRTSFV